MRSLVIITFLICFCDYAIAQEQNIDSLKRQLKNTTGKEQVSTLLELCWELRFVNADTARVYGLRALDLARAAHWEELEVEALNYIGITHEAQGNYDQALSYELPALTLRRKIGDELKTAKTLNDIGIIYDEKGDYETALRFYFEARKIYEQKGDLPKIAMVISNIGIVLKAQKEFSRVVNYYREALSIYTRLNNKFGITVCHANLGAVFFNLQEYDSALLYSQKAVDGFTALNNQQFLGASLCNAGMALHKLKRSKEAVSTLMEAKKLYEAYDNKKELSFLMTYLAGINRESGDYSSALSNAKQGLQIAETIGAREEAMKAHKELLEIYARQRKYEDAFREYEKYEIVKDSLFELEKSKQISELQTKYETEKKESRINLLTQENEIKDIKIKQATLLVVGLVFLIGALIAFGWLWKNRIKLKQQALLDAERAELRQQQLQAVISSQEEERKRFAADLHDGLGQIISALRLGLSKEQLSPTVIPYSLGLLNDMNVEIRNIAFNLMPQVLTTEGLHEALKEFALRINQSGGVFIDVQTYDLDPAMDSSRRIALYRICQEWVNNVIKYSGCHKISIQAVQHPEELVITIEDDGNGFDPDSLTRGKGNGWKNINSRLSLIKGVIEIDSVKDRKGTIAILSAPC